MATYPSIELLLRKAARGVGQINARTSAISGALRPYAGNVAGYFGPIESSAGSIGSSLSAGLQSQGAQLGGDITGALQGIQAPQAAVNQFGGGTALAGQQAGAAVGALSSAELARLHSQGTAEQIYASALPRLAELAGEQEKRNFMAQMQSDLQDLSLQEAQNARDDFLAEREWQFKMQQYQQGVRRQRAQDKLAQKATAYKIKQDTLERKRRAKLDKLAADAAAKEYGLKATDTYSKTQARATSSQASASRAATSAASERERERHNRAQERVAQQRANQAGTGSGSSASSAKYWDRQRKSAFSRAQSYGKSKNERREKNRITKETARARLWHEFGTDLVGHGFDRKTVNTMISNALDAAGY